MNSRSNSSDGHVYVWGYGYGYGYGYGNGYGDSYSDGHGGDSTGGSGYSHGGFDAGSEENKRYWLAAITQFSLKWPEQQRRRFQSATASGLQIALWRSGPGGQPFNGGTPLEAAAAPGVIHTAPGPLKLCEAGTLHATLSPYDWKGGMWWVVALHGTVISDDDGKYGCLKREILGECV